MDLRIIIFAIFIFSFNFVSAQSDNDNVIVRIEKQAEFRYENYKSFIEFVIDDMEFPEEIIESIKGEQKYYFTYVVDLTGKVTNVELVRGENSKLTELIIYKIESSPLWKPATVNDKPVSSRMTIPVVFKMSDIYRITNPTLLH